MKKLNVLLLLFILCIPLFIIGITHHSNHIISKGTYSFKPSIQVNVNYTINHYNEAKNFSQTVLEDCSKEKDTLVCIETTLNKYNRIYMGDCNQNIHVRPFDFVTERKVRFCQKVSIEGKDESLKFALYVPDLAPPDDITGLIAHKGLLTWDLIHSPDVVKILILGSSLPFSAYDPALLIKELESSLTSFQGMTSKYYMVYPVDAKGNIGNKNKPAIS